MSSGDESLVYYVSPPLDKPQSASPPSDTRISLVRTASGHKRPALDGQFKERDVKKPRGLRFGSDIPLED